MAQTKSPNNNGPNKTTPVTVVPPAFNPATDTPEKGKDPATFAVEQQWRTVAAQKLDKQHPATINKNSSYNKG